MVDFTGGGVVIAGGGAGVGGVGDRLGAVSVVEHVDRGVGAVSVFDGYLALGTVPEVLVMTELCWV